MTLLQIPVIILTFPEPPVLEQIEKAPSLHILLSLEQGS